FTTEFDQALKHKTIDSLKKKYRNCDVLLIDDIQFLSGKEGTQQEFFHTFNTLHQTNRQIVMTSDTRPKSIPQLEPRLSSRFSWGMVADLQTPDLETRQAILQHKCEEKNFDLDPEMVEYTAKQVQNNVRELEGALNAIITHCELYAVKPSMKLIERILEQTGTDRKITHITAETICQTVADFFSLNLVDLLGKRRNKELVHPRQITMYLMRHELAYSFPKIGKALGGKDHTTVMHGVEKIKKELVRNDNLQRDIALIKEKLYVSG
ncbi:chromosomal replication initiator protein DnaA, partial [Candidatus Berkelbacteria bacterium]|nr:chromosomal replication initiator protein DnaA [Candidatus Berkelbacteria bacterium]